MQMQMHIITTPRLVLRPLEPRDACDITRLIGNFEVLRWLARPPFPYTDADARQFLAAIAGKDDSERDLVRAIGFGPRAPLVGIVSIEASRDGPMLGYWLGQSYWGRGFMTEAAGALTRHFFANPGNMTLQSAFLSGNEASAAIQRRLGFEVAGIGTVMSRALGRDVPDIRTCLTRARFELMSR